MHRNMRWHLTSVALLLKATGRFAEAEVLMRRALEIDLANLGPDNPSVSVRLYNLAVLLQATNRPTEAEPLMRRALEIDEKNYGPDHPNVGRDLGGLGQILQDTNRLAEAEPLLRRSLAIDESHLRIDLLGRDFSDLAAVLQAMNQFTEAELMMRRALKLDETILGSDHPNVGNDLNNLAVLLKATNRLAEAEPLMRRALKIDEANLGPDHPDVGRDLNNLAQALKATNRLAEAEPLMRRALKIDEASFGPNHPKVATALNNLAQLLQDTDRLSDAEPLMRRALKIEEASFGPNHPDVAAALNNLAQLLQDTDRLSEAEPLMRRALKIEEASFGPDHPDVAKALNNLAALLDATNRLTEAEPLMRRALAIDKKSFGPDHPTVGRGLNNLAALLEDQGHWSNAVALYAQAKPIMTGAHAASELERGGLRKAFLAQNTGGFRGYARALYHVGASNAANRAEGFELAQWALQNEAADALSSMSARFAKGGQQLAKLVREQQDLLAGREAAYRSLDAAAGKADAKGAEAGRAAIAQIEARLAEKQAALRQAFPDYAELANPKPLSLADAQALLGEGQALVVFLDLPQYGKVPEETIVFVLTQKEARWVSIPLGTLALRERVTALRCGLDHTNWREGQKSREICKKLLNTEVSEDRQPPFDAAAAHALYRDLFGGVEDLIKDKSLLIVPSGALTQLPFEALVTEEPDANAGALRGLQNSGLARSAPSRHGAAVGWKPQSTAHRQRQRSAGAVHRLRQSASDRRKGHRQERVGQTGLRQGCAAGTNPRCELV